LEIRSVGFHSRTVLFAVLCLGFSDFLSRFLADRMDYSLCALISDTMSSISLRIRLNIRIDAS
jgi:hypothetical protein